VSTQTIPSREVSMAEKARTGPEWDDGPIFDLFAAHMQTRITEIAVRIGMFEALREPVDISDLCVTLSIGRRAAESFVAVLAASGLAEVNGETAHLTDIAREYFLADSPFFKGALFKLIPDDEYELVRRVHLREESFRPTTQRWLAGKVRDVIGQAEHMHAQTFPACAAFARHPQLHGARSVLDVAGGAGTFSIALALHNPAIQCVVMDLPCMRPAVRALIERYRLPGNISFVGGDMFAGAWQGRHDAVLFSNVLHDWDLTRCAALAAKAFEALLPGGRVFINEMLLNESKDGPIGTALFSAMMLLHMEGKQLTFPELSAVLEGAGFVNVATVATFGYYSLTTAEKPANSN
jgi:hypothetical protein